MTYRPTDDNEPEFTKPCREAFHVFKCSTSSTEEYFCDGHLRCHRLSAGPDDSTRMVLAPTLSVFQTVSFSFMFHKA